MNYSKIYTNLIEKGKMNTTTEYTEMHHIVPKCIGGGDELTNLVALTPEQHYLAHQLLAKMYPNVPGLLFACKLMTANSCGTRSRNKLYGWIRRKCNVVHGSSIKDGWAAKAGFKSYNDQASSIWMLYIVDGLSVPEISTRFGISQGNVNGCLKFWAKDNNLEKELATSKFDKKSKNSKHARANIDPKAEALRIERAKSADYSNRTQGSGKDNPSAVTVTIDDAEYGSIREAAVALGVTYAVCVNRLKSNNWPSWSRD